jgi:hypothetical protein
MRTFVHGSSLIILAAIMSGCGSTSTPPKSDMASATHLTDADSSVLQSGGSDVLRLATPANTTRVARDGSLTLTTPQLVLNVWLVPGAKTIDEGVTSIGKQIASEFKDFKPDQTTDLTIAAAPAKRLSGTGHEADDGDNGQADLIVFKVGDHIFLALTHDEALPATARQGLLTIVQSAESP